MEKLDSFHMDEQEAAAEREHFNRILKAFDSYLPFSLAQNNVRRNSYVSLPRAHQELLADLGPKLPLPQLPVESAGSRNSPETRAVQGQGVKARLDEMDDRIRRNADFLSLIVQDARGFLGAEGDDAAGSSSGSGSVTTGEQENQSAEDSAEAHGRSHAHFHAHSHSPVLPATAPEPSSAEEPVATEGRSASAAVTERGGGVRRKRKRIQGQDLDKVRSTLKQFARDWSTLGSSERASAYDPILAALERYMLCPTISARAEKRILVPGAGLGRLAFDIAKKGYSCQGNEFSFFMLVASHFVLNSTRTVGEHVIYPFVHSASNWRKAEDLLIPVVIPDVLPSSIPTGVDFSMVAGEVRSSLYLQGGFKLETDLNFFL